MRDQLQKRLEELKTEFNTGRARAAELEQQQVTLHQTLLRISGAIQVLEEELNVQSQNTDHKNGEPLGDIALANPKHANGASGHVGA